MEKKAVIYGVRSGDTYHYIGKTIKINHEGEVTNSRVQRQYMLPELREVFISNEVAVEELSSCNEDQWYDEKLSEVVTKHKDSHPLLNAQWMLDGKRGIWEGTGGYWQGKTKDQYTIDRLSESKFKPVLQYDVDGNFVREWESKKAVSLAVFKDYRVKGGGGRTKLYSILGNKNPRRHLRFGSYWFSKADFKRIPKTLDIDTMYKKFLKDYPRPVKTHQVQYSVEHYVRGKLKKTYPNVGVCAKRLKVHRTTVAITCRGLIKNPCYDLRYGEKTLQPVAKKN